MVEFYQRNRDSPIRDGFQILIYILFFAFLIGAIFYIEYRIDENNTDINSKITNLEIRMDSIDSNIDIFSEAQKSNEYINQMYIDISNLKIKVDKIHSDVDYDDVEDYVEDYTEDELDDLSDKIDDLEVDIEALLEIVNNNTETINNFTSS